MDRKIFHESFYQKAMREYDRALEQAKHQLNGEVYSDKYVRDNLNQAAADIQEILDQGFTDTIQKIKDDMAEIVQKFVDKSEELQRKDGTAELLRRQDLQTKAKNYDFEELLKFIQNQTQKEVIPEFDYYTLNEAAEPYTGQGNAQSMQLDTALIELRRKLPQNAAEQSSEYQKLKDFLTETKFVPHRGDIFIKDDTGHYGMVHIESSFDALFQNRML